MKILGFQSGHDVSYCILENGIPIIHEELERFTREKEPLGDGLDMAFQRISDDELNEITHISYGNPGRRIGKCGLKKSERKLKSLNVDYSIIGHHQSHAANAFFSSNFDEALVITLDGSGVEKSNYKDYSKDCYTLKENFEYFSSSCTFWLGKDLNIKPIERIPTSKLTIGSPWQIYTGEIFGLSNGYPEGNSAGTVMAMAAVGDSNKYWKDFYDAFVAGGSFYGRSSARVSGNILKYKPIAEKSEQDAFDVAAGLQRATEEVCKKIITPYIEKYNPKHICMAGGVALNSVMIGKMYDWFPNIEQIFICPVPYDGGLSIGSAQYVYHHILKNPRVTWKNNCSPYLGKKYYKEDILKSIDNKKDLITFETVDDNYVIDLLDKQNIISVFGGESESGRRALGNRSILADPRSSKMKDIINEKVKHRQWFRPFAPSILREDVKEWFEKDVDSPYMTTVLNWKEEVKDKVPAVVHLDGTARLQTVTKNDNKWYYNFIKKFKEYTNVPVLLNTSFNDREPIVETPEHAINCFLGTDIDYLYFYDYGILVTNCYK